MRIFSGKRRKIYGCLGFFIVVAGLIAWVYGPAIRDFSKAGLLQDLLAPEKKRKWQPETEANLRALYTALKLHHESEGQLPTASTWMDAALRRVKAADMQKDEAQKKFFDPASGGKFGFAFNDAMSEKYLPDVTDKGTVLLFQTTEDTWNAHGDPAKIGRLGGRAITVEGTLVELP